ncbi:MAG TPA: NAD(P)-dependent oxidoreductase, partial [Acetobacteraceae bacterium]|nr:NAD(P)-dependent oxidoreductase [Acetobacteraceae bacterium]
MDVGFIGLGRMGRAMARNIVKGGHRVRAWNRSPNAANAIDGVTMIASPKDAFQAEVVFTMLSDDAAIRSVVLSSNVLRETRPGVVHVVASTISIAFAEELRARHEEAGLGYVSAPVFGRPDVAEAGQLSIMAAGAKDAVAKVLPLLDLVGRRTWVLGEDPKQANAAKIAGNMMIAMAIEAMAEAVVLTGSNGLRPEPFFDLMLHTLFGAAAYETYSAKIAKGDFEPGFRMQLGLKDLGLAAAAAEQAGKRLPQLDAVRARMIEAVAAGMGEKDWSAVADYTLRH